MGKRQEIRQRRKRERTRNRFLVIGLVTAGALLIGFAFIMPMIQKTKNETAATLFPVISVTPKGIYKQVDGLHLGNPDAPIKVDLFEDFRCSACKHYTENYEAQIIQTYVDTGKVYYTYHTYIVIDNATEDASLQAANAAMCAAEQGRFWDYHDTLYANQVTESAALFTDERLTSMAQTLNLDMTAFTQCFLGKRYASEIQKDINEAETLGVTFTPSIFVNGTLIQSYNELATAIDTTLAGQ